MHLNRTTKRRSRSTVLLSMIFSFILFLSACNGLTPAGSGSDSLLTSSGNSISSPDNAGSSSAGSSSESQSAVLLTPTPTPGVTLTPTPAPTETLLNRFMYVNVDIANFRTAPNTVNSTIIKQLYYQTRVQQILVTGDWSKIVTGNDETGYISTEFLSPSMPPAKPTAAPARTLTQWPAVSTLDSVYHSVKLQDFIGRTKGTGYEPLKGITVILDPGHGGADPGAVYNGTLHEKTINLRVALETRTYLQSMGATVVMTHETDSTFGLYYRNAFINKYILNRHKEKLVLKGKDVSEVNRLIGLMDQVMAANSDNVSLKARGVFFGLGMNEDIRTSLDISREYTDVILISIHCNIIVNSPSTRGIEIYYGTNNAIFQDEKSLVKNESPSNPIYPEYQFYDDAARKKFGTALRSSLQSTVPEMKMRGGNGLYAWNFCMIRENNLTSALIELGFMSNASDRAFLVDPANQKKMALGIADSVYNYYCVN